MIPIDTIFPFWGFVYVLHNPQDGLYKIGYSADVKKRRAAIRQQFKGAGIYLVTDMECWNMVETERSLHWMFKEKCVRLEWFALDAEDIHKIKQRAEREATEVIYQKKYLKKVDAHNRKQAREAARNG